MNSDFVLELLFLIFVVVFTPLSLVFILYIFKMYLSQSEYQRMEDMFMSLPKEERDRLLAMYETEAVQQAHQGDGANAPPDSK